MTTGTHEPEPVSGGWLRATRHTLGLSVDKLAMLIDVNADTITKRWEHGDSGIPHGVRTDVTKLVEYTDAVVERMRRKAEAIPDPAIVVYSGRDDLPENHIALVYGRDWWDRVAFSVWQLVPEVMIGFPWEIAAAYDHAATHSDIYADPSVICMYSTAGRAATP
jgi:hypothetical protein